MLFSSIDTENWLQITGEASAGAGSLLFKPLPQPLPSLCL